MALLSRITTWSAGNKLTAAALNAEFDLLVDALDGTTDINVKIEHTAAALPTLQLGNTHGSGYALQAGDGTSDDLFGVLSTGVIESKVTTGTAPLIVASTTQVANLNADLLDGDEAANFFRLDEASQTWQAPSAGLLFEMYSVGTNDVELRMGAVSGLADYWKVLYDYSEGELIFHYYDSGATLTGDVISFGYSFLSGREALVQVGGPAPTGSHAGGVLRIHGSETEYHDIHAVDDVLTIEDSLNDEMVAFDGGASEVQYTADLVINEEATLQIDGNNGAKLQALSVSTSFLSFDADQGSAGLCTLDDSATLLNIINPVIGATYQLIIKQDGVGSHTLAYGSSYKFSGGGAPTITAAAGSVDILTIFVESSTIFHVIAVQNMI